MSLLYRMGTGNGSGGDLKPFIVNFTCHSGFIGKTVTMEFQGTPHAGEVVENVSGTVASDGTLTLYPMHDGLWKYYATSDVSGYHEGTITLEKWGNYPVELIDTPNGATVTPTDDVQTWLHCADVWNKSYTTISEVVADTTTLNTLIANENANDYLVRSTTFATDICSNESAMTYIGLNDYCANKLLADSTWLEAICNSEYFKKVLTENVPTMTSDSQPEGLVIYNNPYPGLETMAHKIFKNETPDAKIYYGAYGDSYIGYKFAKSITVNKMVVYPLYEDNKCKFYECILEASNDNSEWTPLGTYYCDKGSSALNGTIHKNSFSIANDTPYLYYRVIGKREGGSGYIFINALQFYGR